VFIYVFLLFIESYPLWHCGNPWIFCSFAFHSLAVISVAYSLDTPGVCNYLFLCFILVFFFITANLQFMFTHTYTRIWFLLNSVTYPQLIQVMPGPHDWDCFIIAVWYVVGV